MNNFIIRNESNYKRWAFWLFIAYIVTNFGSLSLVLANFSQQLIKPSIFFAILQTGSIVSKLTLVAGIIFTILSYKNGEEKDYQYKVAVWGFTIILLLFIISLLLKNFL